MKDSLKKLDLMLVCYLGKWHPITREQINEKGIGSVLMVINSIAGRIFNNNYDQEDIENIRAQYSYIINRYNNLPWNELDEKDEDFSTLYKTRELLDDYKNSIESLIGNPNKESYSSFREVVVKISSADGPINFDKKIRDLYNRLKKNKIKYFFISTYQHFLKLLQQK